MDASLIARFVFTLLGCSCVSPLFAQAPIPHPMQMQRPAPTPMIARARQSQPFALARPEVRSENFIVIAATRELADEVARAAEQQRHDLAVQWLGHPLPRWPQPCPITVMAGPEIGAGGSTTFTMARGTVGDWRMNVQGSQERILDSVLPHEVTHTVLATHFAPLGRPVPRWADEGACTTVEHSSEKSKHDHYLVEFLSHGRGIPFATMFSLKEYPADIMPLYAQGYSVSSFLIAQGGPRRFVQFLEDGMRTDDWVTATEKHYGYPKIGKLQNAWNQWVADGGGAVDKHTAIALGMSNQAIASNNVSVIPVSAPQQGALSSVRSSPATSAISADSWYKRQLSENSNSAEPANVATSSTPTPVAPTSNPDYSVSHQQGVQGSTGGPAGKWADGPSVPLYR